MLISECAKMIGLSESAPVEEVTEKLKEIGIVIGKTKKMQEKMQEKIEEARQENRELKKQKALARIEKTGDLVERLKYQNDKVKTLQRKLDRQDGNKVLNHAMCEGKVLPRDLTFWLNRYLDDPIKTLEILRYLKPVVILNEIGSDGDGPPDKNPNADPGKEIIELAEKMQIERKVSFAVAMDAIQVENPDLTKRYIERYTGPK